MRTARHDGELAAHRRLRRLRPARDVLVRGAGLRPRARPARLGQWLDYWRAAGIPEEELEGAENGSGAIVDPEGVRPRIWFQEVPEPKAVKNRLHLDIRHTPGREAMPYAERRGERGRGGRAAGRPRRDAWPTSTRPRAPTTTP